MEANWTKAWLELQLFNPLHIPWLPEKLPERLSGESFEAPD